MKLPKQHNPIKQDFKGYTKVAVFINVVRRGAILLFSKLGLVKATRDFHSR